MTTGIELIAYERLRQTQIGWTSKHDDGHVSGELIAAAICYAGIVRLCEMDAPIDYSTPPFDWPFEDDAWNPSESYVRNLVQAGALIAAEIDRLQRLNGAV